jgi:hypothetical protein
MGAAPAAAGPAVSPAVAPATNPQYEPGGSRTTPAAPSAENTAAEFAKSYFPYVPAHAADPAVAAAALTPPPAPPAHAVAADRVLSQLVPPAAPIPAPAVPARDTATEAARPLTPTSPQVAAGDVASEEPPGAVAAVTEGALQTVVALPVLDPRRAVPAELPLPLDLPPVDWHVWAGAVGRLFQGLDAQTREAEEEPSFVTRIAPWCVTLGALGVSLEFARRWFARRSQDLTDVPPRGLAWDWLPDRARPSAEKQP